MIKLVFSLALGLISPVLSSQGFASELEILERGSFQKTIAKASIISTLKPIEIAVQDPHTAEERTIYKAFSFTDFLDQAYKERWKKMDEIVMTCLDGYQGTILVEKLKRFPSFLAYDVPSGKKFEIIKEYEGKVKVDLGPYYLIWDNQKHPELIKEGPLDWPYQVTGIDIIKFEDRYAGMAPPTRSPKRARRGFLHFRKHCQSCHSINGVGGKKAIDLNYPVSVSEYMKELWIRKWIDNPAQIRPEVQMPPLSDVGKNRKKVINDILAYLRIMARHKNQPKGSQPSDS